MGVLDDLRYACRALARMPGLGAVVILSLGVGIGVNTAVFSWLQAFVFKPLPGVRDAGAFYLAEPRAPTGSYPGSSWLEYQDLQERLPSLTNLFAFRLTPFNVGEPSRAERVFGQFVSANYFAALGLQPAAGRFLRPDEVARPGGDPVVVVSHDYGQTRFAGATNAIGQPLRVNGQALTIVGVAPRGFQGTVVGLGFDLWVPATMAPALFRGSRELEDRSQRGYSVMGRLQPRVTTARARAEMDGAMRDLAALYPATNATMRGEVIPFAMSPRGPQRMLAGALAVLQAVMLLLLLAVCGNTANLVLARASTRYGEIGVRRALGAGRWRVGRLILAENLVMALAASALGTAIAVWGTNALRAVPLPGGVPLKLQTSVDLGGLAFAIGLGVACGLLFGAVPAVHLARIDPHQALRSGVRTASRSRLRHALMGVQVTLALVVLFVAALFFGSLRETRATDPGFRVEGVLLAAYDLSGLNLDEPTARAFAGRLLDRLRAVPAIEAAAIASSVPLDIHGLPMRSFTLEGRPEAVASPDQALTNVVTPGYFALMGIPFRRGVDFASLDDRGAGPQAIVNDEFVRRFIAPGEPLGRHITSRGAIYTIVGVVRNSLSDSFGEPAAPVIFLSYRDRPMAIGQIHLRVRSGAEAVLVAPLRRVVADVDPSLPLYDVRTMAEHIEKNLVLRRIPARMFVVLGPLILVLAAIGIYAVVSYTVAQRRTEIGLRMAFGATARRVVIQIVGEALRSIGAGAAAGWLMALLIEVDLIGKSVRDLPALVGVPAILLLVAACACWLPARRAAQGDPMAALRHE